MPITMTKKEQLSMDAEHTAKMNLAILITEKALKDLEHERRFRVTHTKRKIKRFIREKLHCSVTFIVHANFYPNIKSTYTSFILQLHAMMLRDKLFMDFMIDGSMYIMDLEINLDKGAFDVKITFVVLPDDMC